MILGKLHHFYFWVDLVVFVYLRDDIMLLVWNSKQALRIDFIVIYNNFLKLFRSWFLHFYGKHFRITFSFNFRLYFSFFFLNFFFPLVILKLLVFWEQWGFVPFSLQSLMHMERSSSWLHFIESRFLGFFLKIIEDLRCLRLL